MTLAEIEKRLNTLEQTVENLQLRVSRQDNGPRRWWVEDAGRFADDPLFDEIVRLGGEYRESLRPTKSGRKK